MLLGGKTTGRVEGRKDGPWCGASPEIWELLCKVYLDARILASGYNERFRECRPTLSISSLEF